MGLETYTAGDAMDRAAVLLNDGNKDLYSYAAQLPYLRIAWDELKQRLEQNDYPFTNEISSSAGLHVVAGQTDIGGSTGPALPSDLIEPISLYERTWGSSEDFTLMDKRTFPPLIETPASALMYWSWMQQTIQFPESGSTTDRQVRIQYLGDTLGTITDQTTVITLLSSENALSFRTAALCARFIGENATRADELDGFASGSLDTLLAVSTKMRQNITTRRRPFRASWKRNSVT